MLYMDTSAVMKLVHPEAETVALREWFGRHPDLPWVASSLIEVELVRAVRVAAPAHLVHIPTVLARLEMVEIDGVVRGNAATVLRRQCTAWMPSTPPPPSKSLPI